MGALVERIISHFALVLQESSNFFNFTDSWGNDEYTFYGELRCQYSFSQKYTVNIQDILEIINKI